MKKTTLLTLLCVCMGLINIGLLWWMLSGPPRPKHEGPRAVIIEKLGFDQGQGARYDVLINEHRNSIGAIEAKINSEKKALYSFLVQNQSTNSGAPSPEVADSITTIIGQLQQEIELIHFLHFSEIRSICRPDQYEKYNALCSELADLFAPPYMRHIREEGLPR
jgi:periplasmic protein CpxP/Spy